LDSEPIDVDGLVAALTAVLAGTPWEAQVEPSISAWESIRAGVATTLPANAALLSCALNDLAGPLSALLAGLHAAPPADEAALIATLAAARADVGAGLTRLDAILPILRDEAVACGLITGDLDLLPEDLPELRRGITAGLQAISTGLEQAGAQDQAFADAMLAGLRDISGQAWRGQVTELREHIGQVRDLTAITAAAARANQALRQLRALVPVPVPDECDADDEIKLWLGIIALIVMILSFEALVLALALGPLGLALDALLVSFLSGATATMVIYYFAMAVVILQIGLAGYNTFEQISQCFCATWTGEE
jgi:hypothetical protein